MVVYAADDEKYMLDALMEAIGKVLPNADLKGYRLSHELLDAVQEEPCDIAFLDIHMPGTDGIALAKKILALHEETNIIFVTGFDNYKGEAMDMYASAYLMKPVTEDKVREAVKHLRYPLQRKEKRCRAVTFGNFAVYVDGRPMTFHRRKSAELLAYLVAKGGTVVSRSELTLTLFEDETHSQKSRKNLDNAIRTLREDLELAGAGELLYRESDGLAVNRELLDADLFDFENGDRHLYHGQFLEQYSWGALFEEIFE